MLAALAVQAAGHEVLWVRGGPGCPQEAHLHILRAAIQPVLAAMDAELGARIAAATEPAHVWRDASGAAHPAPRLTRSGLVAALAAACASRGLVPQENEPCPADAETWIDATGGARALARRFEATGLGRLDLEDIGTGRAWRTETWAADLPGAPFTQVLPGRAYVETGGGTRRTMREDAGADLPRPDGAADRVVRMIAPPLRLARWQALRGASPVILFGDARLQTPPEMGFGLHAVAQQAAILAGALAQRRDPDPPLADWAEAVWINAGMQAAFAL